MNYPITVLMPVYNGALFLKEAIDSILSQTFTDFEFLIINDGSTDNTEEIVLSYDDPRIKLITQKNGGVANALNTGLYKATGTYIARMDADDICYPDRLKIQYDFMLQNPDYIVIGSDVDYITEEGEFIFRYINPAYSHTDIQKIVIAVCPFIHSTVFLKKEYALKLKGYPERAHSFEDHLLWTKFIKEGKACNLDQVLVAYRFNTSSVTIDEKDMDKTFLELKRKALDEGDLSSEDEIKLLSSVRKLSKQKKESSYHRMLGKKYLWNNYQPANARKHLIKSLRIEPFTLSSYLIFALSLFPEKIIKRIYATKST